MSMFDQLAAEFPRNLVSWRCQTVSSNNTGLALAYIDARDVMRRLDEVVGPENWQDRYEVHGTKTICYLSVRVNGEWIVKADGAGDTDVEAEKGSISDAFKRAAVKWRIGRYLYDIETPWVPCEVSEKNGKRYWKKWNADPWKFVKSSAPAQPARAEQAGGELSPPASPSADGHRTVANTLTAALKKAKTGAELAKWFADNSATVEGLPEDLKDEVRGAYAEHLHNLKRAA